MPLNKPFTVKNILIPVDFSDTSLLAIEYASKIASVFKANITIVHVLETYSFKIQIPELNVLNEVPTDLTKVIENKLTQFAEEVESKTGCSVKIKTISGGKVSEKIIETAKSLSTDLIVMGTHGAKGFEEFFIGSNAYRVVTDSPCPVLSVQKNASTGGLKNILLPLDESRHSLEKVRYAAVLAKHFNAKVHVIGLSESDDKEVVGRVKLKMEKTATYLKNGGIQFETTKLDGSNYAKLIEEYSAKINADLVVIMTEQNEEITGWFLGPFAQQVVNHSSVPVLSIRPSKGFIEFPDLSGGFHAF